MKKCTKCEVERNLAEFYRDKNRKDGYTLHCKFCYKKYQQDNKKLIAERNKQHYLKNKSLFAERDKQYYLKNKKTIIEKQKQYRRKRRANDPVYRMIGNLYSGLYQAMKGTSKSKRTMQLLGCSWGHFKQHMSAQFVEGMTLENYGEWHVDHIIPVSSFNHSYPEQVATCWHYTNLQPLWAKDNLSKGDKMPHEL